MPMGIVSDSEFDSELHRNREKSNSVPLIGTILPANHPGRKPGDVNVPDGLRRIIGETSISDGPAEAVKLAESFGISRSSVSAYANGATSTSTYDRKPNNDVIHNAKQSLAKRARGRLKQAMIALTDDKLSAASARDLSGIAKDMAVVAKNMEPESAKINGDGKDKPQFIFYAPTILNENTFEVITAKDG